MDDDKTGRIIEMASLRPVEQLGWSGRLRRNKEGALLPTVANAMVILSNDPVTKGMLALNTFTSQHLLMRGTWNRR